MKKPDSLKTFLQIIVALVASGYNKVIAVEIPRKKQHKSDAIIAKIQRLYKTDLTRSQRAYRKKKGEANTQALYYKGKIYLLSTSGLREDSFFENKKVIDFAKTKKLKLAISEYVTLDLFIDERTKHTIKMNNALFAEFKNEFNQAYKNHSGRYYNQTMNRLMNFPTFRAIQMQKIELMKYLQKQHRQYGVNWRIPKIT